MQAKCKLVIDFDDKTKAENVLKSVKVDDFSFVKSRINNKTLEAEITSNSVSSLIHTLDDYLSCISVAEKVVNKRD